MERTEHYASYVKILGEELLPAMGCTEPIAVALAAAKAREALGAAPETCRLEVSGNIIKNVKSVVVPNTGGLKGLEAAAAAGAAAGDASRELEVLADVTPAQKDAIAKLLKTMPITVVPSKNGKVFYINVALTGGGHSAVCEITDFHTNITHLQRDDAVLVHQEPAAAAADDHTDRSVLSVEEIVRFADTVDLSDVSALLERQIAYNTAISDQGLSGSWGAEVGKTLLEFGGDSPEIRAAAAAAAGSDARMSGCELPVVIVSGSGNQGMTTSLPVIQFARELGSGREALLRALVVANLMTIHQKTSIGRLSAFCGATSAGCGAACGIAYLEGGKADALGQIVVNTLATCSGMTCDGAKPSCASKIAAAVQAGLLGYRMYQKGRGFHGGDGILKDGAEATIASVGRLANPGMLGTDAEILQIMVGE